MPSVRVLGVVPNRPVAEQVVGNLRLAGFGQNDVSFIVVKPEQAARMDAQAADQTGKGSRRVLRGVLIGAVIGLVIGCAIGFFLGTLPFFSAVLPQGVLIAACGLVCFIVGGLAGSFSTENLPNQVIERYGMELRAGQAIVSVDAPDQDIAKMAEEVMNTNGAVKVNSFLVQDEDLDQKLTEEANVTEVKPTMHTTANAPATPQEAQVIDASRQKASTNTARQKTPQQNVSRQKRRR